MMNYIKFVFMNIKAYKFKYIKMIFLFAFTFFLLSSFSAFTISYKKAMNSFGIEYGVDNYFSLYDYDFNENPISEKSQFISMSYQVISFTDVTLNDVKYSISIPKSYYMYNYNNDFFPENYMKTCEYSNTSNLILGRMPTAPTEICITNDFYSIISQFTNSVLGSYIKIDIDDYVQNYEIVGIGNFLYESEFENYFYISDSDELASNAYLYDKRVYLSSFGDYDTATNELDSKNVTYDYEGSDAYESYKYLCSFNNIMNNFFLVLFFPLVFSLIMISVFELINHHKIQKNIAYTYKCYGMRRKSRVLIDTLEILFIIIVSSILSTIAFILMKEYINSFFTNYGLDMFLSLSVIIIVNMLVLFSTALIILPVKILMNFVSKKELF